MTTLDNRFNTYSPAALTAFRVIFGLLYAIHGSMKLFGWPLGESVPVGSWPMWWAGLIELVAGLLITVGLFTRIAAFIASGEMAVAYFWQHWPPLEGPSQSFWPMANGGEAAVMFSFAFLLLATMGAGAYSIDGRRRPVGTTTTGSAPRAGLFSRFRR
ncbi:DoxX family protein [Mycolicibacterium sp. XJ1819]